MNILDYSQASTWDRCPLRWYERYINKRVPKPRVAQRNDAMAIGSLVHSGLENWYVHKSMTIDKEVIEEVAPTREAHTQAEALILAYVQHYCNEPWDLVAVEQPIIRPLTPKTNLMAKVDSYFYAKEPMFLETDDGLGLHINPGYWVLEHKTKDASINRAYWMQSWESNLQASFQTLALEHHLGQPIQGVIVNVLEKPRVHVPMRKCKGCGESYELASYRSCGGGEAACPVCEFVQVVKPYQPLRESKPGFFRLKVQRTADQLAYHYGIICGIAEAMEKAREAGGASPRLEECVHKFFGPCEYWTNHTVGISTADDPNMMDKDTTKYMGLVQLAA